MGGDPVDRGQDRLLWRDAAQVGPPSRARPGPAGRTDDGRARADQGAGAGGPRAAAGQRDPEEGVGVFCPGGARPPVRGHDRLHRRSPGDLRGRADLQGSADRPVDVPRPCRATGRSRRLPARAKRGRGADGRDPARVRGELPRLRRAQGLAAARPRGDRGGALHGRPADASDGPGGRRARQEGPDDRSPIRRRPARSTGSTGSSRPRARTGCGSRILPTSRPGAASSTSPS